MLGSFNTRFAQPGDIAGALHARRRGAALVGRLRGQGARPARVGPAPSLHRVQHVPEDHRDLRRPGILVQPRHARDCRDDGERRPAAARQRPAVLPRRNAAWRRHGRVQARNAVDRSECLCEQSQPRARNRSRALCRAGRLGREGDAAAAERVSARQRRHARAGHVCRDGLAEYSKDPEAGRRDQRAARLRLRAAVIATTTAPAS